jgi:hypothetical protein
MYKQPDCDSNLSRRKSSFITISIAISKYSSSSSSPDDEESSKIISLILFIYSWNPVLKPVAKKMKNIPKHSRSYFVEHLVDEGGGNHCRRSWADVEGVRIPPGLRDDPISTYRSRNNNLPSHWSSLRPNTPRQKIGLALGVSAPTTTSSMKEDLRGPHPLTALFSNKPSSSWQKYRDRNGYNPKFCHNSSNDIHQRAKLSGRGGWRRARARGGGNTWLTEWMKKGIGGATTKVRTRVEAESFCYVGLRPSIFRSRRG